MRNIDDVLLTLCLCCMPLLLPAALGVGVYIGWYLPRAQLKRLAEQMGWKLDTRYPLDSI